MKRRFEQHNSVALIIGIIIPEIRVSQPLSALQLLLDIYGKFIYKDQANRI